MGGNKQNNNAITKGIRWVCTLVVCPALSPSTLKRHKHRQEGLYILASGDSNVSGCNLGVGIPFPSAVTENVIFPCQQNANQQKMTCLHFSWWKYSASLFQGASFRDRSLCAFPLHMNRERGVRFLYHFPFSFFPSEDISLSSSLVSPLFRRDRCCYALLSKSSIFPAGARTSPPRRNPDRVLVRLFPGGPLLPPVLSGRDSRFARHRAEESLQNVSFIVGAECGREERYTKCSPSFFSLERFSHSP